MNNDFNASVGFRDLHAYDLSSWRLLQEEEEEKEEEEELKIVSKKEKKKKMTR